MKKIIITENQFNIIKGNIIVENNWLQNQNGVNYIFKESVKPKINSNWKRVVIEKSPYEKINWVELLPNGKETVKIRQVISKDKNGKTSSVYYKEYDTGLITRMSNHWSIYILKNYQLKDFPTIMRDTFVNLIWGPFLSIKANANYNLSLNPLWGDKLISSDVKDIVKKEKPGRDFYVLPRNTLKLAEKVTLTGSIMQPKNDRFDLIEHLIQNENSFVLNEQEENNIIDEKFVSWIIQNA